MATKQVIVMRKDLKMRRGKEIAQGSHASAAFVCQLLKNGQTISLENFSESVREWILSSYAKVCVQVNSEDELLEIYENAKKSGLLAYLITDSGRTEFSGVPTNTCCAIGPDDSEIIDKITGHLKLY